jgi:hypothetical protein
MSLLPLLSLQDEQIEIVTEAVRQWCDDNGHVINDDTGKAALRAAVALALTDKWDPSNFLPRLRREMESLERLNRN